MMGYLYVILPILDLVLDEYKYMHMYLSFLDRKQSAIPWAEETSASQRAAR